MLNSVHDNWMDRLAFGLAFILVLMGLANNLPNIPGLLELIQSIPGLSELPRISKYNSEFFFPLTFTFMTVVVLLRSSFGREWKQVGGGKYILGILIDIFMLSVIITFSLFYLIENEQVCLIDTLNGDRARAMAENMARAQEYLAIFWH